MATPSIVINDGGSAHYHVCTFQEVFERTTIEGQLLSIRISPTASGEYTPTIQIKMGPSLKIKAIDMPKGLNKAQARFLYDLLAIQKTAVSVVVKRSTSEAEFRIATSLYKQTSPQAIADLQGLGNDIPQENPLILVSSIIQKFSERLQGAAGEELVPLLREVVPLAFIPNCSEKLINPLVNKLSRPSSVIEARRLMRALALVIRAHPQNSLLDTAKLLGQRLQSLFLKLRTGYKCQDNPVDLFFQKLKSKETSDVPFNIQVNSYEENLQLQYSIYDLCIALTSRDSSLNLLQLRDADLLETSPQRIIKFQEKAMVPNNKKNSVDFLFLVSIHRVRTMEYENEWIHRALLCREIDTLRNNIVSETLTSLAAECSYSLTASLLTWSSNKAEMTAKQEHWKNIFKNENYLECALFGETIVPIKEMLQEELKGKDTEPLSRVVPVETMRFFLASIITETISPEIRWQTYVLLNYILTNVEIPCTNLLFLPKTNVSSVFQNRKTLDETESKLNTERIDLFFGEKERDSSSPFPSSPSSSLLEVTKSDLFPLEMWNLQIRVPEGHIHRSVILGEHSDANPRLLKDAIDDFLAQPEKLVLALLGRAGSGKTQSCLFILQTLRDQNSDFTPLYVNMRDVKHDLDNHPFFKGRKSQQIQELKANKKILFIFDEVDDLQFQKNPYVYFKMGDWKKSKVVVVSRIEGLNLTDEVDTLFAPKDAFDHPLPNRLCVYHLCSLNQQQLQLVPSYRSLNDTQKKTVDNFCEQHITLFTNSPKLYSHLVEVASKLATPSQYRLRRNFLQKLSSHVIGNPGELPFLGKENQVVTSRSYETSRLLSKVDSSQDLFEAWKKTGVVCRAADGTFAFVDSFIQAHFVADFLLQKAIGIINAPSNLTFNPLNQFWLADCPTTLFLLLEQSSHKRSWFLENRDQFIQILNDSAMEHDQNCLRSNIMSILAGLRIPMNNVSLEGCQLIKAVLDGGLLDGANLQYANLRGATLRGASLRKANLTGCEMQNATVSDVLYFYPKDRLPQQLTISPSGRTKATLFDNGKQLRVVDIEKREDRVVRLAKENSEPTCLAVCLLDDDTLFMVQEDASMNYLSLSKAMPALEIIANNIEMSSTGVIKIASNFSCPWFFFACQGNTLYYIDKLKREKIHEISLKQVIVGLQLSVNGNWLAIACKNRHVAQVETSTTPSIIFDAPSPHQPNPSGKSDDFECIAIAQETGYLALGTHSGKIEVYELQRTGYITLLYTATSSHGGPVTSLAISAGIIASSGTDGIIYLHKLANGNLTTVFTGHTHEIKEVAFSSKNGNLFSIGLDGTERIWQTDLPSIYHRTVTPSRPKKLIYYEEQDSICVVDSSANIEIWNCKTIAPPRYFEGHKASVCFAAKANVSQLRTLSADSTMITWDIVSGEKQEVFENGSTSTSATSNLATNSNAGKIVKAAHTGELEVSNDSLIQMGFNLSNILKLELSPDGKCLGVLQKNGKLSFVTGSKNKFDNRLLKGTFTDFAFSSDSSLIALIPDIKIPNSIDIYQTGKYQKPYEQVHIPGDYKYSAIGFTTDNKCIGIGCEDGSLIVWSLEDSKVLLEEVRSHRREISALVFIKENQTLLTADADHHVKFWQWAWTPKSPPALTLKWVSSPQENFEQANIANTNGLSSTNRFLLKDFFHAVEDTKNADIATLLKGFAVLDREGNRMNESTSLENDSNISARNLLQSHCVSLTKTSQQLISDDDDDTTSHIVIPLHGVAKEAMHALEKDLVPLFFLNLPLQSPSIWPPFRLMADSLLENVIGKSNSAHSTIDKGPAARHVWLLTKKTSPSDLKRIVSVINRSGDFLIVDCRDLLELDKQTLEVFCSSRWIGFSSHSNLYPFKEKLKEIKLLQSCVLVNAENEKNPSWLKTVERDFENYKILFSPELDYESKWKIKVTIENTKNQEKREARLNDAASSFSTPHLEIALDFLTTFPIISVANHVVTFGSMKEDNPESLLQHIVFLNSTSSLSLRLREQAKTLLQPSSTSSHSKRKELSDTWKNLLQPASVLALSTDDEIVSRSLEILSHYNPSLNEDNSFTVKIINAVIAARKIDKETFQKLARKHVECPNVDSLRLLEAVLQRMLEKFGDLTTLKSELRPKLNKIILTTTNSKLKHQATLCMNIL